MAWASPYSSRGYADALRSMPTEEEELRRRMAALRPDYAGIASQEAELAGQEAQLQRQRDYAQALMGTPLPQGRTVGPSSIYVQNPYEGLATAAQRLAGGYFAGKANEREEAEVAPARLALSTARADAQGKDFDMQVLTATEAARQQRLGREADAAETAAALESREDIAAANRESANARAESEQALRRELAQLQSDTRLTVQEREAELEREMAGAAADSDVQGLQAAGYTPETINAVRQLGSAGERKAARTMLVAVDEINEAMRLADVAIDAGKDWTGGAKEWGIAAAETVGGVFGDAGRRAGRGQAKDAAYDSQEQAVRGEILRAVEAFRRSETGANLTAIEEALGEDWNPVNAKSEAEALRRMGALVEYMNTGLEAYGVPAQSVYSRENREPATSVRDIRRGVDDEDEFDSYWNQ